MKKKTFPMLLATALVAASCTTDSDSGVEIDDSLKTKIEFTMTDEATGKAFLMNETRAGFATATQVAARFVSTNGTSTRAAKTVLNAAAAGSKAYSDVIYASTGETRYWDDCFGRDAKLSVYAVAVPGQSGVTNGATPKTLEELLDLSGTQKNNWVTGEGSNGITWTMSNVQNSATLSQEDLCYSNNITSDGADGRYVYDYSTPGYPDFPDDIAEMSTVLGDGEMQFKYQDDEDHTGPGKFDKGHMIFKHATAQISVDVKVGSGFTFTSEHNTFKFTETNKNVELIGFNRTGTLNIKTGEWGSLSDDRIDALNCTTTSAGAALVSGDGLNTKFYELQGQFIPGKTISMSNNTAAIQLTIDHNTYYISEADIYKALVTDKYAENVTGGLISLIGGNSFKFEAGKNYKFTITVGKTGISAITATLIPWANVEASELTPSTGRITLTTRLFSGDGVTTETATDAFSLYRALDQADAIRDDYVGYTWKSGYNTDGAATLTYASSKYSTNWYWENSKSYYHFRTLKGASITTDAVNGDYFTMTSGASESTDYKWGAPFVTGSYKIDYDDAKGFDIQDGETHTQLSQAIGPLRNDQVINITEQHMMSNIKVILQTTDNSEGDAVQLYDNSDSEHPVGATVTLTNFYNQAKVLMGTGLVTPITEGGEAMKASQIMTSPATTSAETYFKTANRVTKAFTWSVVPQKVDRGSGNPRYIGLTIKTPDNNQYYVVADLSTITGTTSSAFKADKYDGSAITRWYPGYEYTYTITLKKTGIKAITASVVDWVPVTAADKTVTLESKRFGRWK